MKHCRFCAEEIQDAAIVCRHCGHDLLTPAKALAPASPSDAGKVWLGGLLVAAAIALGMGGVFFLNRDTGGSGLIGLACLLAILARIAQASGQYRQP